MAVQARHALLRGALAVLATLAFATPATAAIHVVAAGETLTSVAAADGLSVAQLAAANGMSATAELISGQTLTIPPQSAGAGSAASDDTSGSAASSLPSAAPAGLNEGAYVVQPGDTLTGIAARAGTTIASLAAVNGLDPNGYLIQGTVLSLNGLASAASAAGAAAPTSTDTAAATPDAPPSTGSVADTGMPPYPTAERVSAGDVGQIAAGQGVSASLAEAIGWQESGFNNDIVSPTGATGVMQIEPGTWSWIQSNLAGGSLAPASAHDNVEGGVLLLRQLLADTGGNASLAAAAYYQGLASVQRYGMYPSTQSYVANVLALSNQFGG